jgi:hypothetical protein
MLNFIDETNKVFWIIVPKSEMNKPSGILAVALADYKCDKNVIVLNSEEYRNTNGYRDIAEKISVDYTKDNLVFVELMI